MPCVSRLAASVWLLCCGDGDWLCGMSGSPVGTPVLAMCVPVLLVGRHSALSV